MTNPTTWRRLGSDKVNSMLLSSGIKEEELSGLSYDDRVNKIVEIKKKTYSKLGGTTPRDVMPKQKRLTKKIIKNDRISSLIDVEENEEENDDEIIHTIKITEKPKQLDPLTALMYSRLRRR